MVGRPAYRPADRENTQAAGGKVGPRTSGRAFSRRVALLRETQQARAMLAYFCLLAFIGLGTCSDIEKIMPSRYEIEKSINRTIEEVEKMIEGNPSLPKLSRNDIVNILYNITATDMHSIEDEALLAIQKTREDYRRALMVVLPYKLQDSENLKELYTKPPIVQLVSDESDSSKEAKNEISFSPSYYSTDGARQTENLVDNKHQLITAHMRFENNEKDNTSEVSNFGDFQPMTTTYKPDDAKVESEPQKFSFNLDEMDQRAEASHLSIATKRPIYKGTFSRYRTSTQTPPKIEIVYSSTAKTSTEANFEVETTTAKNYPTQSVLSADQWQYNAPPTTTTVKTVKPDTSPWKPMMPSKGFFLPTIQSSVEEEDKADFTIIKMEDFRNVMETTTTSTTARPAPIFVTPSVTTNPKTPTSSVKSVPIVFRLSTTTTTVQPTPMREEVEQLLKSIGLQPVKTNKQQNEVKLNQNSLNTQLNAYLDSKLQDSKYDAVKMDLSSVKKDIAFEAPQLPAKDGVQNLSPDIQLLFQQFGLQVPQEEKATTTTTTTRRPATIPSSINSYTHFKPLPTSPVKDNDFRKFLAKFGLGIGDNRNQKAMQSETTTRRPSLIESVPENMKKILENIGLIKKSPKLTRSERESDSTFVIQTELPKIVEQTTPSPEHIFKPQEIPLDNKAQNEKIKQLLRTVKMVQEGKANVEDVQKVAHDLLQSTKSLGSGPDPLKLEEILNNYRESLKNEVKRQQEQTTTEAATSTEELDETALSSMATTGTNLSSTSAPGNDDSKSTKTDQNSSSSATEEKKEKPSFFDTFDIDAYIKNNTNSDSSSTTAAPTTSSGTTAKGSFFDTFDIDAYINSTTEDPESKNSKVKLSDLEDSFGGSTPEPDPVIPTRPKTGLYFLVDWNTFLEVGEEGKERVSLRFSPKVGDRTRFLPVKIP